MIRSLDYKEVEKNIIEDVKEFAGKKKVVVGISGGADSALTAILCVKALGKENVVGLLLPYGVQKDIEDSENLVKEIGVDYEIINIRTIVDQCISKITSINRMVGANIMARVRMTILYAKANELNGLVAGTTNKSEFEIGYGTKYGDLACDFEVIEELYKTEVVDMLEKIAKDDELLILEKIANKEPTAGLWDGQTDQKELGFSYETLDKFLQGEKIDKESELKIKRLVLNSEHKRHLPAVIKINQYYSYALIIGRFQPLCNHHVEMIKEVIKKSGAEKLLIGIGDSLKVDNRNFLKSDEVKEMLEKILKKLNINYKLKIIRDINNPPKYCHHVQSFFSEINESNTQLFTENDYTKDCFVNYGHNYKVVSPTIIDNKATSIRKLMMEDDLIWKDYVPEEVVEYIEKNNLISRLRELNTCVSINL